MNAPSSPCLAILGHTTSELTLLNLDDGSKYYVKIPVSEQKSRSIVTIDNEIYIVTEAEIMRFHRYGKTSLLKLENMKPTFEVVSFQKKIYIIPTEQMMLAYDPADKSITKDLPGCGLGVGFCVCASDECIYAMGGFTTPTVVKKYNPLEGKEWVEIAKMTKERKGAAAATLGGKVFVMGGAFAKDSVEVYNPSDGKWTEISNMNVCRSHFSTCVVGNILYVIGGDFTETKNEYTVEIYDGGAWEVKQAFHSEDWQFFACIWPYGSFKPGYDQLQAGFRVSKGSKNIGQDGGTVELQGCRVRLPPGALTHEKEIGFRLHSDHQQDQNALSVTPILECDPPMTFERPVRMQMRTCVSAQAGDTIPVTLLTRNDPNGIWEETEKLDLSDRNEIEFQIRRCSEMKVVSKAHKGKFHIISDFYIHPGTGTITTVFSKDQTVHDATEKTLHDRNYINFAVGPHNVIGNVGKEISVAMECRRPTCCKITDEVLPSPRITVGEDFFLAGTKEAYFELEPDPPKDCARINLLYSCFVDEELQYQLPLGVEWSQDEDGRREGRNRSGSTVINNTFHTNANQVAINRGRIYSEGASNVTVTDRSTDVQGPVNYLATEGGNVTDRSTGNTNIAENGRQTQSSEEEN